METWIKEVEPEHEQPRTVRLQFERETGEEAQLDFMRRERLYNFRENFAQYDYREDLAVIEEEEKNDETH